MAFFSFLHFHQVYLYHWSIAATKHGEDLKSVKPATTQYFLRELKERAVMDVQDGHTHTLESSGTRLQTAPSATVWGLCSTQEGEIDGQMDSQAV